MPWHWTSFALCRRHSYVETVADLLVKAAPAGHGAVIFAPAERERVGAAAVALANERLHGGRLTWRMKRVPCGAVSSSAMER